MSKEAILDDQHWTHQDYKQRITTKDWRELLLNDDDKIIFRGRVTQLVCNRLGSGVVEISKQTKEQPSGN